jgi:hypothetical protein
VGGVDQVDAQVDGPPEESMGLPWIPRLLPDPRKAHGAEREAVDRHHTTKRDRSGQAG